MVLLGLLLLLAACERRGYEISASGVAAYVWDNNPMHFGGIVRRDVPVADPTTFVQLSANPAFGRDTRHAFYEAEIIAGANPASFRPLGDSLYSTDDESVFFKAQRIPAADLASFRALADDYAVDAHNTYLRGDVVPGARGVLTKIRNNGYLRDEANQIFYRSCYGCQIKQIDACDGATFDAGVFLREPEAWDRLCVYADAQRLPLTDRASYRYLGDHWSKDKGGVYYFNQRIDAADPATFGLVRSNNDNVVLGSDASGRCWFGTSPAQVSCSADAKPYTDPDVSPASVYAPRR